MFDIQEELKKLPKKPGVYLMHDAHDEIIYVGKAVVLYNRVHSYFRAGTKKTPKIQKMVSLISWFEYIVTDSELEALILENNLIKEHRPKYNTMLKDDKTYPYIKVTVQEDFPRIMSVRKVQKDHARYFGPYTSEGSVKDTIELLRKVYMIRNCKSSQNERSCLYYHIGQCMAPCVGGITREDYRVNVEKMLDFLSGNNKDILRELTEKMNSASEEMNFEEALKWRDLIASVKAVSQKQKITDFDGENRDIVAMARQDNSVIIQLFFVRDGKMVGKDHYYMKHVEEEDDASILGSFLMQYYAQAPVLPKEIVVPCEPQDGELLRQVLANQRGSKVLLTVPQKGKKEKLVELAGENARLHLSQDLEKIRREYAKTLGAVSRLGELIGVPNPVRIEAYDISNISGYESVGSMVVFEDGKPKTNDYRKFRIKTVIGPNDYASMEEVLTRRFTHGVAERAEAEEESSDGEKKKVQKFGKFPDLILMDGGRGQVNIALQVLQELGLSIPVCGMVKDDHHRTRGLYCDNREVEIAPSSEEFKLITRIQDEAHRFAITFHRNLRSKSQVHSVLDDIPGIGEKRRRSLMRQYASLEDIKNASVEELAAVDSFTLPAAQAVYDFLHTQS